MSNCELRPQVRPCLLRLLLQLATVNRRQATAVQLSLEMAQASVHFPDSFCGVCYWKLHYSGDRIEMLYYYGAMCAVCTEGHSGEGQYQSTRPVASFSTFPFPIFHILPSLLFGAWYHFGALLRTIICNVDSNFKFNLPQITVSSYLLLIRFSHGAEHLLTLRR